MVVLVLVSLELLLPSSAAAGIAAAALLAHPIVKEGGRSGACPVPGNQNRTNKKSQNKST